MRGLRPSPRQRPTLTPLRRTALGASIAFNKALGFTQNLQFSDDTSACMVWSEAIYAMLLTHAKWRSFTERPMPPAGRSEVQLALSFDGRDAVDRFNQAAAAQDLGFLFSRDVADPDGHVWSAFWMDPAAMPLAARAA
jgi:predicted lactoylglutathione lyase